MVRKANFDFNDKPEMIKAIFKINPVTTNYHDLINKPKINHVELEGDKSLEDLGITSKIDEIVADHDASEEAHPYIQEKISDEAEAREAADTILDGKISDEAEARTLADETLDGKISDEIEARTLADETLDGKISDEIEARELADTVLDGKISDETEARTLADETLDGKIDDETEARTLADETLDGKIDDEIEARELADTTLDGKIDDEIEARELADETLDGKIDDESEARELADTTLDGKIDDEAEARSLADEALGGRIDDEAEARALADETLDGKIDLKANITDIKNGVLTIQRNSASVGTFSANQDSNVTVNISVPVSTSELTNNSDYQTGTNVASSISDHNVSDVAHADIRQSVGTNTEDIATINSLIPSTATTQNQLADKNFVNSSIASNTANFIGTFNSVADLEAYSGTLTPNDYAFVISTDSLGATVYDRYKWNGTEWLYEYTLNNSSFTSDQWATINSGLTATDKTNLDNHLINTNNPHSVTKAQVGLGNVDNTSDMNKPVSTAQQAALDGKIDKLSQLPAADASNYKLIVQYVGETGSGYTKGYFYECAKETTYASSVEFTPNAGVSTVVSIDPDDFANFMINLCANNPQWGSDGRNITHGSIGIYSATQYSLSADTEEGLLFYAVFDITELEAAGFSFTPPFGAQEGATFTCAIEAPVSETYAWTQIDVQPETDISGKVDKTTDSDKVYGTDAQGNQTTYDKGSFGQVDDVQINGTSIVSNKVANIEPVTLSGTYGVVKLGDGKGGLAINSAGNLYVVGASQGQTAAKLGNINNPVMPGQIDTAVKAGMTTNTLTLTDAEKTAACGWIGALENVQINGTDLTKDVNNKVNIPAAALDGANSVYGVVKLYTINYGLGVTDGGYLNVVGADNADITGKATTKKPLLPKNVDLVVKTGMTTNTLTWSDTEKTNARTLIGAIGDVQANSTSLVTDGVATIPIVANDVLGLVKGDGGVRGVNFFASGSPYIVRAIDDEVTAKTSTFKPLTPVNIDLATKVGITTNTITLTTAEKTSACGWIGALENVQINGTDLTKDANNKVNIPAAANGGDYGVVKLANSGSSFGLGVHSSGNLYVVGATDAQITNKTRINNALLPGSIDLIVKTGVTTNTIALSGSEQTSACNWLGTLNVLTGTSAPLSSTTGMLGQLYQDTVTGYIYRCVSIDDTDPQDIVYTWRQLVDDVQLNSESVVTNGIATIPISDGTTTLGVVKGNTSRGVSTFTGGYLTTVPASVQEIELKANQYKPLAPSTIDHAVKVGVSTNTLTLSASEKQAASNWILPSQTADMVLGSDGTNTSWDYAVEFIDWID